MVSSYCFSQDQIRKKGLCILFSDFYSAAIFKSLDPLWKLLTHSSCLVFTDQASLKQDINSLAKEHQSSFGQKKH